jgi:hypothetical protein
MDGSSSEILTRTVDSDSPSMTEFSPCEGFSAIKLLKLASLQGYALKGLASKFVWNPSEQ